MKWEAADTGDGTEHFTHDNVKLARIWPVGKRWQIAIFLPLAQKPTHLHDFRCNAKDCVESYVEAWFKRMTA